MLQQLVFLHGQKPGTRALIVGAEHVSFSAILTLAHAGTEVVGMVTELPRHQSLAVFRLGTRFRYRTPLWTRTVVAAIHGSPHVEEVELADVVTGRTRRVSCDTVVFTADWIPDHELAVTAGLDLDPGTLGPAVDTCLRTSRVGVFAAGNVLHAAETADVAALSGRHVAVSAARFLADGVWPSPRVPIVCEPPLGWIVPNVLSPEPARPPRHRFLLRSRSFLDGPEIQIVQDARSLWTGRLRRSIPGRSARLPDSWTRSFDPGGEAIRVGVVRA